MRNLQYLGNIVLGMVALIIVTFPLWSFVYSLLYTSSTALCGSLSFCPVVIDSLVIICDPTFHSLLLSWFFFSCAKENNHPLDHYKVKEKRPSKLKNMDMLPPHYDKVQFFRGVSVKVLKKYLVV